MDYNCPNCSFIIIQFVMTYPFFYSIFEFNNKDNTKDGIIFASDMNDAIDKATAICPNGWRFSTIMKIAK